MPTVTPTVTQVPTGTQTQTRVPTETPEPSATVVVSATPPTGFTFYGAQLEFLRTVLGWGYEVSDCLYNLEEAANLKVSEPGKCVMGVNVYPSKKERLVGNYLFLANYYKFVGDSRSAIPYEYFFYHYDGTFVDPAVDWLSLDPHAVWRWTADNGFMRKVANYYGLDYPDELPPDPIRILPLTTEEYLTILSRPDLFPGWVESHK